MAVQGLDILSQAVAGLRPGGMDSCGVKPRCAPGDTDIPKTFLWTVTSSFGQSEIRFAVLYWPVSRGESTPHKAHRHVCPAVVGE